MLIFCYINWRYAYEFIHVRLRHPALFGVCLWVQRMLLDRVPWSLPVRRPVLAQPARWILR